MKNNSLLDFIFEKSSFVHRNSGYLIIIFFSFNFFAFTTPTNTFHKCSSERIVKKNNAITSCNSLNSIDISDCEVKSINLRYAHKIMRVKNTSESSEHNVFVIVASD